MYIQGIYLEVKKEGLLGQNPEEHQKLKMGREKVWRRQWKGTTGRLEENQEFDY